MARNLEHLELPRIRGEFPRRLYGGGYTPKRSNKLVHGRHLIRETAKVIKKYKTVSRHKGISPALLFKLKVHPKANLWRDPRKLYHC